VALQVTAGLAAWATVAVKSKLWPATRLTVLWLSETVTGGGVAMIVTLAEAVAVGSASETTLTVTVAGVGTAAGAVYTPEFEIAPRVESPPACPFTCQNTVSFAAFFTVAWNDTVELGGHGVCIHICTLAVVGVMLTVTGGGRGLIVMVAVLETDVSAALPA
jgi:hypothetical protein